MPKLSKGQTRTFGKQQTNKGEHAWSRLYPLANQVLHYDKMNAQPHVEMCDFIESLIPHVLAGTTHTGQQTKGLMLVPRGCFKTTIGTVSLAIHVLERNPNARILIYSHTWDYSMQILQEIKHHLENNETFIELFGDWKEGSQLWDRQAIKIGLRTEAKKEPSIDTAGADKSKNGGHYDLIICDDLHEERNSANATQRAKIWNLIQNIGPILEPGGTLLVTGTRWDERDAYSKILELNTKVEKENARLRLQDSHKPLTHQPYKTLIRAAFQPDLTLYAPTILTDEVLAQKRLELDDKKFAKFYLNKTIEDGSKFFQASQIKWYSGTYLYDRGVGLIRMDDGRQISVRATLALDPALSDKKKSDFSGFTVILTDPLGNRFVHVAEAFKGLPDAVADRFVYYATMFRPAAMSIETVAAQTLYINLIKPRLAEVGISTSITEYRPPNTISKQAKIQGLQPILKQGKLHLLRGQTGELATQLDQFPQNEHDDLLDSLIQHEQIIRLPSPRELLTLLYGELKEEDNFDVDEDSDGAAHTRTGSYVGLGAPTR